MAIRVAMLAACLLVLSPAAADQAEQTRMYSKFIHLMHDKHYAEAVDFAFAREKAGDGWAKSQVEGWYAGSGDPDDAPPPVVRMVNERLNRAASGGDARAQMTLGVRLLQSGDESRLAEAVRWLDKAADQGDRHAMYVLGSMSAKALASRGITSKHAGKLLRNE